MSDHLRKLAKGMDAFEDSKRKKVKVKISYTLEVDVEEWAEEFGTAPTAVAVSADVKTYYSTDAGVIASYPVESGIAKDVTPNG